MSKPIIAGHRGAAGLAPENTPAAFRKAAALGLRMVELDVRLTRDGVLVCFHDDRLDRLTAARGLVAEWDWAALAELPVLPGAFGGAYPDARIPRLSEVMTALPTGVHVLVELKAEPDRPDELVRRTLETVTAAGATARCRFISFEYDLLQRLRAAEPELRLGVLVGARERDLLLERARELRAEAVHPQFRWVDVDWCAAAQREGFLVNAWTVNSLEEVRRLVALDVDEITTDYPDMALAALASGADGPG